MNGVYKTIRQLAQSPYFYIGTGIIILSSLLALPSHTIIQPAVLRSINKQVVLPKPSPTPYRLEPVPSIVKAVYLTGYSAGNSEKIQEIISLAKTTELNGVVIDIKDYTGKVFFKTNSPLIQAINSEDIRIPDFSSLIKTLHDHNLYVVARIAVFQDVHLAKARPSLAVKNSQTGANWQDRKGLLWVDPASREVWDYNLEIARAAIKLGIDEINLDYVRFPSDGNMNSLSYPVYNPALNSKAEQMRQFFAYVHEALKDEPVTSSVDLFGLTTVNEDDLGIGQIIEYAYPYFDYICPMVYPSHYASGFLEYKNPAAYPYEVVNYSLQKAQARQERLAYAILNNNIDPEKSTATTTVSIIEDIKIDQIDKNNKLGKLRPWLQAFDLGATYTPEMVRKQIQAVYDNHLDSGWYLWNPSNVYNSAALLKE